MIIICQNTDFVGEKIIRAFDFNLQSFCMYMAVPGRWSFNAANKCFRKLQVLELSETLVYCIKLPPGM